MDIKRVHQRHGGQRAVGAYQLRGQALGLHLHANT
jgi:hypothetical protein